MPDADASTTDNAPAPEAETSETSPTAPVEEAAKPDQKVFDEAYVKQLRGEAAKYRSEAKNAAEELEKLRKAAMSEQERAIVEARAEGRLSAMSEFGARVVDAEIRAAAAGRFTDGQMRVLLQGLNRSAFLAEDGSVDEKSVHEFVDGIAPPPQQATDQRTILDLGQGARGDANALNGDPLLRDIKAKLGIA
jgi:glucose/arabinose dehydrogenase